MSRSAGLRAILGEEDTQKQNEEAERLEARRSAWFVMDR
jgi:hypothetical protein